VSWLTTRCRKVMGWSLLALLVWGLVVVAPTLANEPTGTPAPGAVPPIPEPEAVVGNVVDGYAVTLDGEELFLVREGIEGVTSAEERANIIAQRVLAIANDPTILPEDIRADIQAQQSIVLAGDTVLFTVREEDTAAYGQPHPQLAETAVERIQQELVHYREKRSVQRIVTSIVLTIASTIALVVFLRGLFFGSSRLLTYIRVKRRAGTLVVRVRSLLLFGAGATSYLLSALVRLLRLVVILLAFYVYVPFVLSQFPATEAFGDSLLRDIAIRLNFLVQAFVAYLPNLVTIGFIGAITYYLIGFAAQVIAELGRADVYPWFYPEWVQPTIRLMALLIGAIALVIVGPYLPGFGSPAFQGISLFIGALVTLGSSSAVANALSGIILIYTRAFQLGDFVRINDITGTVKDKSLFVTRILTLRQETVTIPNASVLNNNVTNYSAICREDKGYLMLSTTVTLGYDVPWRKIHTVMVAAAQATKEITAQPAPFVLQSALNDFNVSYQLNAFTAKPHLMPLIYSELHENIQDKCNEADIEILSPAFSALRDGNPSTIPADYLPEDYTPPGFLVRQDTSPAPGQPTVH